MAFYDIHVNETPEDEETMVLMLLSWPPTSYIWNVTPRPVGPQILKCDPIKLFPLFNIQIPSWCDFCMKQTPEDGEIMRCDYTTLTATTETATCFIAKYRPNYTEYSDKMPLWALLLFKINPLVAFCPIFLTRTNTWCCHGRQISGWKDTFRAVVILW